jgi:acetyl esterase/lipase
LPRDPVLRKVAHGSGPGASPQMRRVLRSVCHGRGRGSRSSIHSGLSPWPSIPKPRPCSTWFTASAPPFHELDVHQARHSFEKLQFALRPEAPAVASVTDVPIPHARDRVIMARLYRPLQSRSDDVLPVTFYFHGGGCVSAIFRVMTCCVASLPITAGAPSCRLTIVLPPSTPSRARGRRAEGCGLVARQCSAVGG